MNIRMIGGILSRILGVEAFFMLPSLLLALADGQTGTAYAFAATMGITAILALVLLLFGRKAPRSFYAKEGMVCVGSAWIVMSLVGCLPFCLSGEIPSFVDAFFEMVSGFTTTGASVVPDVEALSRAVLYWRAFSHWLGGMGVLVFILAVTPSLFGAGGFSMHLLRAESPGPTVGKLAPRMKKTASILYLLYIVLTVVNVVFLLFGGMDPFDAVCTAFGTAGTGGFGNYADSIGSFSPYIQNVCTVFMLLFGINFSLYHLLLLGQFRPVLKNEELRLYLGLIVGGSGLIAFNVRGLYSSFGETLRHASFQAVSIITTTGFATVDFNVWPTFSKTILLLLMIAGACAGSTGGGLKCARILILFKSAKRHLKRRLCPNRVELVRCNGQVVEEEVIRGTEIYFAAYGFLMLGSFLLVAIESPSVTTAFSAVLSCVNNIGPGLDAVGPAANFGFYGDFTKLVLIFDMLAGRLEIFPLFALFSAKSWKRS